MIGLHVTSAPRDGVAVLKFLVDIAAGKGGKIVDELLAAEAKLAKMEAEANAGLDARERAIADREAIADKKVVDATTKAQALVEQAEKRAADLRKELEVSVRAEQAKLDKANQALEEKRLALVVRVAEVEAFNKLANERMATAEKLNAGALATARKYEAWLTNVEAVKV